ncbi:DNA helicase, DnaB-like, C-terminal [uncultured Caudovirales phage]|uniref:DNA helicase, DnaB-like, C-terminal n=1 Tax=uncultured Caudovirales phage TaxID=2100421 RepID=A0A6J5KRL1_9CAUD|nr:DNA helicase, DnaB-like, C-terminal [uncultured Caudovirales phage]
MSKLTPEQIAAALTPSSFKKKQNNIIGVNTNPVDVSVSLDEIESFGNVESIKNMYTNVASYNKMLQEKITFINPAMTRCIPFTRENLYLICAYTGNGKSTIAANISHPLWKEGRRTLVIANEEPEQDILYRIACLELGINFNDYKKGTILPADQLACMKLFPEISKYVKVLDVNYKEGLTTKLEGIKNALEAVKTKDYAAVMIDYFQLVRYSVNDTSRSTYSVLDDFRIFLGQYIKGSNIPVVLFAQLHSIGKRNNPELDSRVKECPGILETATVVLEVVPDFETKMTTFKIAKDRFGMQGGRIDCAFDKGKFVEVTAAHLEQTRASKIEALMKKATGSDSSVEIGDEDI